MTQNIKAKITPNQSFLVTNYQINASTIRLVDLFDVDGTDQTDGAMLVYKATASKWVTTTQIDNINTIINGGNF
jgi:hypothetical protein